MRREVIRQTKGADRNKEGQRDHGLAANAGVKHEELLHAGMQAHHPIYDIPT